MKTNPLFHPGLVLLAVTLVCRPLIVGAQDAASATAVEAAPAPAAAAKETPAKPRLQIDIGGSDLDPVLREKLSPEQLLELELARRQPHGAWDNLESYLVPILVPMGFFLMIFGIVAITLWSRMRQRQLMHETVRLFLDKGQPVPAELFSPAEKPRSGLRRGLAGIGLGLGLIFFFLGVERSMWGIGCIPLFLGLGHLLAWKLETPQSGQKPPAL